MGRRLFEYLAKLENGDDTTPSISQEQLDQYLRSHLINPALLRADDFKAFMQDRQKRLLALIEQATGKAAYAGDVPEEEDDLDAGLLEADDDIVEAELTIAAS